MVDLSSFASLGVVPVLVNAGAALLPALVAGATSVVSLFFRPKALVRAVAEHPAKAGIAVGVLAVVAILVVWMCMPAEAPTDRPKAEKTLAMGMMNVDWRAMAMEWMRDGGGAVASTAAIQSGGAIIYGRDPGRDNYGGGGSPLGLRPLWEFPKPGTPAAKELDNAMYLSSPAVVGDAVYGASCLLDPPGNYGSVFCLDAATGQQRWMVSTFKNAKGKDKDFRGFFSSPAVSADGKYLVIGQGLHMDGDSELVCLDATTGRVHWTVPTPLHIECSPAIDGDLAVAGAGAIEDDDHKPKTHPGLVIAVSISTGKKLWEYQVNDPESSPLILDGVVYIGSGFNGNAVVALRTESDEELAAKGLKREIWRAPTPNPATGAVTAYEDLVLIGCGNSDYVFVAPNPEGAVIALDRKTGEVRWKIKTPDAVLGTIAVRDGKAICPIRNGRVMAIDLKAADKSKPLWEADVHDGKPVMAGVAFTGPYVYAISHDGYLAVIDAADGKVIERLYINAKGRAGEMGLTVSSPSVVGGRLYVGTETGGLRCFAGKEVKP